MSNDTDLDKLGDDLNFEAPVFAERFEDALDHLVNKCPVAHSNLGPGYKIFNRYRDVRRCAQDWRTFSSADGWMMDPPEGNIYILPEDSDPPYQHNWRRVLNPFFTADVVEKLEPHAREYAGALIDKFKDRGHCEYVAEFAAQLPGVILFKHILPVPVDDLPTMFHEIDIYSFGALEERAAAFGRVYAYLQSFLETRSTQPPKGDLVDVILAGVDNVDGPCSFKDKVHVALDVVFGGLATTTHAMSGAIYELASKPDLQRSLLGHAARMETAVEETVRMHAPVVAVSRTVREDTEVAGHSLKAGSRIVLNYAAASRDPEVCTNPRAFDVERPEVVHTAFGVGPHRCLGEHLARLEIRVAIEEFLKRIPRFQIEPGTTPVFESGQLRTMKKLCLQW